MPKDPVAFLCIIALCSAKVNPFFKVFQKIFFALDKHVAEVYNAKKEQWRSSDAAPADTDGRFSFWEAD